MDSKDEQPGRVVTLQGTGPPNADVSVLDWLTPVASVWADGNGRWETTIHCDRTENHMFTVCVANGDTHDSRIWLLEAEKETDRPVEPVEPIARRSRARIGWGLMLIPGLVIVCELAIIVFAQRRTTGTNGVAKTAGLHPTGVTQKHLAVSIKKNGSSHKLLAPKAGARRTWIFKIRSSRPAETLVTVYNPASTTVAVTVSSTGPNGAGLQKELLAPRTSRDFAISQTVHARGGRIRVSAELPVVAQQLILGPDGAVAGT